MANKHNILRFHENKITCCNQPINWRKTWTMTFTNEQTDDLQAENIKNIFTRVGKLRSDYSQYCSTAVNFYKANMLTLGVQNIREMYALCTTLACPISKGKVKSNMAHMPLPNPAPSSMYTQVNPT